MHDRKHFSENLCEIEKHQLHLSFAFSERYENRCAVCCVYQHQYGTTTFNLYHNIITNTHKIDWPIMLLSMPRQLDVIQFKCDDEFSKITK